MTKPHFQIKDRFQKRSSLYRDILNEDILRDICLRLTGCTEYTCSFDDEVNVGRLAILRYNNFVNYISFSESEILSRNSFFQSFPSALIKFHQEKSKSKNICFYFLQPDGNIETSYFSFMYRLMKTAGTFFINENSFLTNSIVPFNSISDIVLQRDLNRSKNNSNASSYLTVDTDSILQIFGKTYGANKYETTLLCLAVQKISNLKIELYEIEDGNLRRLPAEARSVIASLGINIITSDLTLESEEFERNNSLRSPSYTFNLLEKLGEKKCAFCDCEIPQIIQGAHIWPVSEIKSKNNLDFDDKLRFATDGDNGLWLCNNHHKLFDVNFLYVDADGSLGYLNSLEAVGSEYIKRTTFQMRVPEQFITDGFKLYLSKRNSGLDKNNYRF